ncbi:MAG: response regulator [bacterium]
MCGKITVTYGIYSETGKGTTFKVYFPHTEGIAVYTTPADQATLPEGEEVILLVEDEPMVRELAVETLRGLGYRIIEAGDPVAAITLAKEYPGIIHLLLTDVIMPAMSGNQLARQLLTTHQTMKVLYTSGYTKNMIAHYGVLDSGINFLPKPYTTKELSECVRDVLGRHSQ